MPIISATALKGGVGKTTLVHHMAGALALAGKRVLCVDNDPQASLSSGLFGPAAVEQMDPASTVAALYAGLDPLPEQVIRPSGIEGIDVIAGSMAAARFNLPEPFAAPVEIQTCLRSFLAEVRGPVRRHPDRQPAEPPGRELGRPDRQRLPDRAGRPRRLRVDELSPVLESIRLVTSGPNPSVVMLGLLLTMVQPRLGVHVAYERVLREVHGDGVFATRVPARRRHQGGDLPAPAGDPLQAAGGIGQGVQGAGR